MKSAFITQHAMDQYIARFEPEVTKQEAARQIQELFQGAKIVDKTATKDQVYVSGQAPHIRLVVKDRNVVVTVLPWSEPVDPTATDPYDEYDYELETNSSVETPAEARQRRNNEVYKARLQHLQSLQKQFEELEIERKEIKNKAKRIGETLNCLHNEIRQMQADLGRNHADE